MSYVDSGATRSFVSIALRKKLCDAPESLEFPLEVEIVDDCTMSATRVPRGCVLNLISGRYFIHLVSIPLIGSKVIIGMDLFGPNGAMIHCERQLVRVRTPSTRELVILGESASHGPSLCLAERSMRYLQWGWVPIVLNFPMYFPKDLPGVPPKMQVEF